MYLFIFKKRQAVYIDSLEFRLGFGGVCVCVCVCLSVCGQRKHSTRNKNRSNFVSIFEGRNDMLYGDGIISIIEFRENRNV